MSENKVKWHLYPQEKPINSGSHLVSVIDEGKMKTLVTLWIPQLNMFFAETDMMVTAWAELPEPYKENDNDYRR